MESSEERGYEEEFHPPPIKEFESEVRYMNVSSNMSAELEKNKSSFPVSQSREERLLALRSSAGSPSLPHGGELGLGMGLDANRVSDLWSLRVGHPLPTQFSSPPYQPPGVFQPPFSGTVYLPELSPVIFCNR